MIEAETLQIGNLLICENCIVSVEEISFEKVICRKVCVLTYDENDAIENNTFKIDKKYLYPIELSKKFFQLYSGQIPTEYGIAYPFSKRATFLICEDEDGGFYIGLNNCGKLQRVTPAPFHALHDIQNIFYAMYRESWVINILSLKSAIITERRYRI